MSLWLSLESEFLERIKNGQIFCYFSFLLFWLLQSHLDFKFLEK